MSDPDHPQGGAHEWLHELAEDGARSLVREPVEGWHEIAVLDDLEPVRGQQAEEATPGVDPGLRPALVQPGR